MARLHVAAFTQARPWSEAEFAALLEHAQTHAVCVASGFALWRGVAGEAELLTIAVAPEAQGQGIGAALMHRWMGDAAQSCDSAFLEVADDNAPARALYAKLGFAEVGRRPGYYARADGACDARVLRRSLRPV